MRWVKSQVFQVRVIKKFFESIRSGVVTCSSQGRVIRTTGVGGGGEGGATAPPKLLIWWKFGRNLWEIWARCVKTLAKSLHVLWFYKNGTQNQSTGFIFVWRSCFYLVLFGKVRGNLGKFGKNGAWSVLNWKMCPTWNEMQSFFWRSFSLEFFSGKFGEIWAKILCTPKHLPALTPMIRTKRDWLTRWPPWSFTNPMWHSDNLRLQW